jgi:uroporphyrinogen decarboxylase
MRKGFPIEVPSDMEIYCMTSKERVMMALNHRETDRVPLDIGAINNTTMHFLIETGLKKRLGLKDNGSEIKSRNQGVVVPDESILEYFGADCRSVYFDENQPWQDNGDGTFTDMWGIGQRLNPDGYYYNMCYHPLGNAQTVDDIEAYEFPKLSPYMLKGLRENALKHQDKALVLEGFRESMFGLPSWLRGNVNFYTDLASDDEMCVVLLDKALVFFKSLIDYVMAEVGDLVDIVKFADDLGTQQNMIISPEMYREKIKPYQAQLYGYVKRKYGKKILLHCCGAIRPIIGDFIEIGVDALNPVQISAKNMNPAELKAEFGGAMTFWGGGIDTQNVLNNASPTVVQQDVKHNLECFKSGGGYVFAQVHNIMPTVPLDNVLAMFEAYKKFAGY